MKLEEFNNVYNMSYDQYCDYLTQKYGSGLSDYFTKSWNPNPKCKRTKEGLFAHHVDEDKMIMLSEKKIAQMCPFEWQLKDRIVYCDYLEHLFLHSLICKFPNVNKIPNVDVGIGGVVNFLVPELNDMYSGFPVSQPWKQNCFNVVKNDFDVYLAIIEYFIKWLKETRKDQSVSILLTSFNKKFGLWSADKNEAVFKEIRNIWNK